MYCWDVPTAMLRFAGVTASEESVTAVTVRLAVPVMPLKAAEIAAVPTAKPVANPIDPVALLNEATAILDEPHVASFVMSCFELSENVPVAAYCSVPPTLILAVVGVTAIETIVADVTVSTVVPETSPTLAMMLVVPAARPDASPYEPALLPTEATVVLEELQVAEAVRSLVVLSEYVPVAANCPDVVFAIVGLVGVTAMDCSVAAGGFVTPPFPPHPLSKKKTIRLTPSRVALWNKFFGCKIAPRHRSGG